MEELEQLEFQPLSAASIPVHSPISVFLIPERAEGEL